MNRCNCQHLGQCPFQEDPLKMTYPDGELIYRELTEEEGAKLQKGDFVGTHGQGDVTVVARAINPERAARYATSKTGRKCKADKVVWRLLHPIPEDV